DLEAVLRKVLSGDLLALMLALMMTPRHHDAHRLRQAMEGLGTNEETLMEILSTRPAPQVKDAQTAYSEHFAKLVVALLHKDNVVAVVQSDIEALSASLDTKKTDPAVWINILTSRDTEHLNREGEALEKILDKRFSGDVRMGLKILVQSIQNPYLLLAQRLVPMKTSVVQGVLVSHC
ncbi:hypothetical protein CRUP_002476, partial [Coryphaenoides rupestris]